MLRKKLCFGFFMILSVVNSYANELNYKLSTHILDISKGSGAALVEVQLFKHLEKNNTWLLIDTKKTDQNGRIKEFLPENEKNSQGIYKLVFLTNPYFNGNSFYPEVHVVFEIHTDLHYHVPITISHFGYATYKGN